MSDSVATLSVDIIARDQVSPVLAKLDAQLDRSNASATRAGKAIGQGIGSGSQKAASGALALQSAQARLEAQQGNLAGAADRLRNALAQVGTTTVQSVNAQRQLLAVETQLATGTSALGGHFKSLEGSIGAVGGAIGGLPGQLLTIGSGIGIISAAAGAAVSVVNSFGEAFKFKAELDATTNSIRLQLQGVRDSNQVFAEGQQFAQKYGLTQQELTDSIQSSIGVMRASNATTTDLLTTLSRLQVLAPEKPISEAARALRELQSGDTTSIKELFNIAAKDANRMKAEIQGGADAVAVLSAFLDRTGIGMDTLAARTEGAKGKMIELAQAQEELALAQADFAQGPGLAILEEKITLVRGATRLLTGDFDAMGQSAANAGVSFAASSAGVNAYVQAIIAGQGATQAQIAGNQAAAATTDMLTGALHNGGGGAFVLAGALMQSADAADRNAAAAAAAASAVDQKAAADQLASVDAQTHTVALNALAQQAQQAAAVLLSSGSAGASAAAVLAGSSSQVDVLTAAFYRLAAAQAAAGQAKTKAALDKQTPRQLIGADSDVAGIRGGKHNAVVEARNAQTKAAQDAAAAERNYQQTLGNTGPALAHANAELAQLTKGSAAYINKQNEIAQLQKKADKAAKGGGGGGASTTKLTDQQKLNNSLLASQDQYAQKSEDAEQSHLDRILQINSDFAEKIQKAQQDFGQNQLDSRASFYDNLGKIEDAGLRDSLAAQYEQAFQEAQQIATTKGADVADAFLKAKQEALQAQAQRASEIAQATKEGDKDKAAYLQGVDELYRKAEEARLARIKEGQDSIASERDAALAEEGQKYSDAQAKIGDSADQAAERKIAAAERAGQAVDAEKLRVDALKTSYDALGASGARAGVTPSTTTTPTTATTAAAPVTATPGDLAGALAQLAAGIDAVRRATEAGADKVAGAVKTRFAS